VAVESRQFHAAIAEWEPSRASLDNAALGQLALALENVDRREDAIRVLEDQSRNDSDITGILAGRLKRQWLVDRRQEDAERSLNLYREGLEAARREARPDQQLYLGINVAFMLLAYVEDRAACADMAMQVLDACANVAPHDKWRLAAEGEAYLYLGDFDTAVARYQAALNSGPTPREVESMYQQALLVVGSIGTRTLADKFEAMFRGSGL
jgi:tetratricopeptide (TPR) repeat protein